MGNYTSERVDRQAQKELARGKYAETYRMLTAYAATLRQQAGRVDEGALCDAWLDARTTDAEAEAFMEGARQMKAALAQNTQSVVPTYQQISDYLHSLDRIQREVIEREARALAQNTQRCQPCDGQGNIMDMQCIGCDGTGRAAQNTQGEAVAVGWKDESRAFLAYRLNQMADGGPLAFCADTLRDAASHLHAERARVPEFTPADAALLREAVSRLPKSRYDSGANLAFRFESAFAAPSQPKDAGEVES